MMPASLVRLALIAVAATAPALALAVPDGHPPPVPRKPTIAPKSDEPVRAAAAFGLPAGFSARLFAAEPDVANPVAYSVDEQIGIAHV